MAYTNAELLVMSNELYTGIVENAQLPFLANTRWDKEAQNATEVTILSVGDVTFNTYSQGTAITAEAPAPSQAKLKMDQAKAFAINSWDTDRLVAGYVQAVAAKAAKKAALIPDAYILAMATKANFGTNWIAGSADAVIDVNGSNIATYLRMMNTKLSKQGVPVGQRFVALTPDLIEKVLIAIEKKNVVAQQTTDALFNGTVMKVCGLNIIETNQYSPVGGSGDDYNILYGHIDAIAAAYKPIAVESQRMVREPGDVIFGVLQYGAKVVDAKLAGAAYLQAVAEA